MSETNFATITTSEGTIDVRKHVIFKETVNADGGKSVAQPINRVVVGAVLKNPYADRYDEGLQMLQEAGGVFGEWAMSTAMQLLGNEVKSYGKAGIVGERGELEHVAALLHPKFGKPTRDLSNGISILPSVKKRGPAGAIVDIPIHHKTAMLVRDYFDSVSVCVPDSPTSDEIMVLLAVSDGTRPHPRVGGLSEDEVIGKDGLR